MITVHQMCAATGAKLLLDNSCSRERKHDIPPASQRLMRTRGLAQVALGGPEVKRAALLMTAVQCALGVLIHVALEQPLLPVC